MGGKTTRFSQAKHDCCANMLNAEGIICYCKEKLSGYKVPRDVVFLDEPPKIDGGSWSGRSWRADMVIA